MTCGGCSGAIERALKKAEGRHRIHEIIAMPMRVGIENFTVNLGNQSVVVTPKTASYDEVYQKIAKTGKQVSIE